MPRDFTGRFRGRIVRWNAERYFGFLEQEGLGAEGSVFFHGRQVQDDPELIEVGVLCEFGIRPCQQGREAYNIRFVLPEAA